MPWNSGCCLIAWFYMLIIPSEKAKQLVALRPRPHHGLHAAGRTSRPVAPAPRLRCPVAPAVRPSARPGPAVVRPLPCAQPRRAAPVASFEAPSSQLANSSPVRVLTTSDATSAEETSAPTLLLSRRHHARSAGRPRPRLGPCTVGRAPRPASAPRPHPQPQHLHGHADRGQGVVLRVTAPPGPKATAPPGPNATAPPGPASRPPPPTASPPPPPPSAQAPGAQPASTSLATLRRRAAPPRARRHRARAAIVVGIRH
nr:basic proline-rich protein-like [Aegilops tauschii subsp. strangulata]